MDICSQLTSEIMISLRIVSHTDWYQYGFNYCLLRTDWAMTLRVWFLTQTHLTQYLCLTLTSSTSQREVFGFLVWLVSCGTFISVTDHPVMSWWLKCRLEGWVQLSGGEYFIPHLSLSLSVMLIPSDWDWRKKFQEESQIFFYWEKQMPILKIQTSSLLEWELGRLSHE